jgi:hypothetical protein
MFTGFLSFAGVEIVNDARLAAYASSLNIPGVKSCDDCPTLRAALEQPVYTTPAADDAPWYDATIPESGQVAGFQIASIEGLGDTSVRRIDELTRDGAVVGSRRRSSRQVLVVFRAYASSECAVSYAAGWLAQALKGSECPPKFLGYSPPNSAVSCGSFDFCMLTCCPTVPADINKYKVTLYRTAVTDGPVVTAHKSVVPAGSTCGFAMCEMEVTFTAGDPGWYSSPQNIFNGPISPFFVDTFSYDITETYDQLGCGLNACFTPAPLGCPPSAGIGGADPYPAPCIGNTSGVSNYYSTTLSLAAVTGSKWFDLVPIITYTGSPSTESTEGPVAITLHRAIAGEPCDVQKSGCEVCFEMFAPVMRTGEPNLFDWITRKGYYVSDQALSCNFPVYTRGLVPFNWPTLTCGPDFCMHIYIDEESDRRDGRLQFDVMRRQDAIC